LKDALLILEILLQELIHTRKKQFFLSKIPLWVSYLKSAIENANFIEAKLKTLQLENTVMYSFWMNDWALALSVLKSRKKIEHFVFRCGGFDIWDERHDGNYLPFRYFIYKHTSKIYPNSEEGEVYIKKINMFPEKTECNYWGTTDYGINTLNPDQTFTIVSCSNVIPLKRVALIIEILKNTSFPISWIHFGDGELMEEIKEKAKQLPPAVHVVFKGRVANQDVLSFYKSNSVNLFITTSSTESLPVSIQEAISFGIPVLATNVGGIKEVVNEVTGILIPKDFDPVEISQKLESFRMSEKNTVEGRKKIREFWLTKFNASYVYPRFCEKIKSYQNP
jgi:glycosyltransferase involved in cell wall biosynthesis